MFWDTSSPAAGQLPSVSRTPSPYHGAPMLNPLLSGASATTLWLMEPHAVDYPTTRSSYAAPSGTPTPPAELPEPRQPFEVVRKRPDSDE